MHTMMQLTSDFFAVHEMPLVQGGHMHPKILETEVSMLLEVGPPEIQAPGAPGRSHGTKIFASKFFSHQPQMMLFYAFCGYMWVKLAKKQEKPVILAKYHSYRQNRPK